MPRQRFERASPPDDGGQMGSYTTPAQLLFTAPEDTRSSEMTGVEPFKENATNRGLLVFWASVFVIELVLIAIAV